MSTGLVTRFLAVLASLAATAAMGSAVGDTYEKVLDQNGPPKSQLEAGTMRLLVYPDFTLKIRDGVVVTIEGTPPPSKAPPPTRPPQALTVDQLQTLPPAQRIEALKAMVKQAVDRVNLIVNQPVQGVPLRSDMGAGVWDHGWFHPGAAKPDFNTVDIRTSQETAQYEKFAFITSNLTPGMAFPGDQIEFNGMTKFFYQDRNLPKKRLSQEEMVEVNRLYRVIGKCADQLAKLSAP